MSTNYSYGHRGLTSCVFCNEELTDEHPGKIATRKMNGKVYKETICNKCLEDEPDYHKDKELMDYPNDYDVI